MVSYKIEMWVANHQVYPTSELGIYLYMVKCFVLTTSHSSTLWFHLTGKSWCIIIILGVWLFWGHLGIRQEFLPPKFCIVRYDLCNKKSLFAFPSTSHKGIRIMESSTAFEGSLVKPSSWQYAITIQKIYTNFALAVVDLHGVTNLIAIANYTCSKVIRYIYISSSMLY